MASVRDIHNFGDQFTYQLKKLSEADIDDRDQAAIRERSGRSHSRDTVGGDVLSVASRSARSGPTPGTA